MIRLNKTSKSVSPVAFGIAVVVFCALPNGDVCSAKVALFKCCNETADIYLDNVCTHINDTLPLRVPMNNNGEAKQTYHKDGTFAVTLGAPCPYGRYQLEPYYAQDAFHIDADTGELVTAGAGSFKPDEYCIEVNGFIEDDIGVYPCLPDNVSQSQSADTERLKMTLYSAVMILSVPFLMATFLVYACFWQLRNLHGKSLMCHVLSLTIAYLSLTYNQINNPSSDILCVSSAYVIQFSFMASFFWLNIMCFDLWWTFSGCRPMKGHIRYRETKKFIIYSIYAWGCPSLISIITLFMELSLDVPKYAIRPGFGIQRCWFNTKSATLLYFYGPIGLLLFCNLLMFIYTAVMILKHMREAKVLEGPESKKSVDLEKQRFMLYFKLFLVMGLNWLAEILSWATDNESSLWYLTDIGNALQGVMIFLIFVCKRRVLRLVNKKLCPGVNLVRSTTMTSTKTTNSLLSRSSTINKDLIEMNKKHSVTSDCLEDFKV
ncbi:G-protein coupled receptor Mth2-like isoform X2 [Daktulosphaira vitifoliae]|uniref:G-protein coupled receptor Mth2-like isoform X2 n=1 Tax=Daktulosphaira vitifoliae TaxID=58002 RepID=UPI0021A9D939|nr:G-protein coupled receptor Mth2-like isoform X2 [Daktulosphaira vitifoliae]